MFLILSRRVQLPYLMYPDTKSKETARLEGKQN